LRVTPAGGTQLTRIERLAALYFGAHAILDVAWWAVVLTIDPIRGFFELDPATPRSLNAFIVGDAVILFVLSALASAAITRRSRYAIALASVVTGGSAYVALYLAGWVVLGGHGWIGIVAMTIETSLMIACVIGLARADPS